MARLTGPLLSISAKKTIAKTVTYYRARGMDIARQRVDPAQPRTVNQVAQRTLFSAAVALVVSVIYAVKAAWKTEATAAGRGETWLSRAVRATLATGYVGLTAPGVLMAKLQVFDPATGLSIQATLAPAVVSYVLLNAALEHFTGNAVWDGPATMFYKTAPLAAGTYTGRWFLDGALIATGEHVVAAA